MAAVGTGSVRLRPSPRSSSTVALAPSTPAPSTVASTPTPPPTPLVSSTLASSTLDSTALALPTLSSVRLMPRPMATAAVDGEVAPMALGAAATGATVDTLATAAGGAGATAAGNQSREQRLPGPLITAVQHISTSFQEPNAATNRDRKAKLP